MIGRTQGTGIRILGRGGEDKEEEETEREIWIVTKQKRDKAILR